MSGRTSTRYPAGMDPHKRSVTIKVMAADETVLGGGRYATDVDGFAALRRYVSRFTDRVWAIEGCNGIGDRYPAEALGTGTGLRHRSGTQDPRH